MSTKNHDFFLQFRRNFRLCAYCGTVFLWTGINSVFPIAHRLAIYQTKKSVPEIALRHGEVYFRPVQPLRDITEPGKIR